MNSKILIWTMITILTGTVVTLVTVSGCGTNASMEASRGMPAEATVDQFLTKSSQYSDAAEETLLRSPPRG